MVNRPRFVVEIGESNFFSNSDKGSNYSSIFGSYLCWGIKLFSIALKKQALCIAKSQHGCFNQIHLSNPFYRNDLFSFSFDFKIVFPNNYLDVTFPFVVGTMCSCRLQTRLVKTSFKIAANCLGLVNFFIRLPTEFLPVLRNKVKFLYTRRSSGIGIG